jgi:hypothetical protein
MKVISRKQLPTQSHLGWKALTAYLALAFIGRIYYWCNEKETYINL